MRTEQKHIIWQNQDIDVEDYREWLDEFYPDTDEYDQWSLCADVNNYYLDDERLNLGTVYLPEDIIAIGDLGLWNGRVTGYKEIGGDLADCLYSDCEYCEWYVDEYGNFRCRESHHDGTNYILYRMWRPGISEEQKDNFCEKCYLGTATQRDIYRYTVRSGDYIGQVYGWTYKGRKIS